jgi:hypothetical protein
MFFPPNYLICLASILEPQCGLEYLLFSNPKPKFVLTTTFYEIEYLLSSNPKPKFILTVFHAFMNFGLVLPLEAFSIQPTNN